MNVKVTDLNAVQFRSLKVGATFIEPSHSSRVLVKSAEGSFIVLGTVNGCTNVGDQPWLVLPVLIRSIEVEK